MEMSKSTSSISSRMSVLESSYKETKVRNSLDNKKETPAPRDPDPPAKPPNVPSPTAAGRTLMAMLDDIKKPTAPAPPAASARTDLSADRSPNKLEKTTITEKSEVTSVTRTSGVFDKSSTLERLEREERVEKPTVFGERTATLERRTKADKNGDTDTLIAQLNNRIADLEKLLDVQNKKFTAAIEELSAKLNAETEKRVALQAELHKLAHCVTQV